MAKKHRTGMYEMTNNECYVFIEEYQLPVHQGKHILPAEIQNIWLHLCSNKSYEIGHLHMTLHIWKNLLALLPKHYRK